MDDSYHRVLLYIVKWFATAFAVVAAILLANASTDLLLGLGFGYPAWSLILCGAMIAVGVVIRRMAGLGLARPHR